MLKAFRVLGVVILLSFLLVTAIACKLEYSLHVIVANGQGQVTPTSGDYIDGTLVSIAAIPHSGWKFDRWEGDVIGNQNPLAQVRMDSDKIILAYFIEEQSPTPTPGGVTSAPALGSPANGATITNKTPLFTWTKIASATNYQLQVATNPAFSIVDIVINKTLGDVSSYRSENELVVGTYYWRVRGTNPSVASPWSFGSFTIATEAQGW